MDNLLGAGGGGGGPGQWFLRLPPVTRLWLGSCLIVTATANLEVVNWHDLCLHRIDDAIGHGSSSRVEVWRFLACFLYAGRISFNTVIGLHLMTQVSCRYEQSPVCTRRIVVNPGDFTAQQQMRNRTTPYYDRGETSDYIFCLLCGSVLILLSNFLMLPRLPTSITHNQRYYFFHRQLTHYVVYVWSKQHPNQRINLFGMALAAAYLPFAYMIIGYALNNGEVLPLDIIHGCFVGHLYYYLALVVPQVLGRGRAVLSTPIALVDLCNWLEGRGRVGAVAGRANDGPDLVDVGGVIGG